MKKDYLGPNGVEKPKQMPRFVKSTNVMATSARSAINKTGWQVAQSEGRFRLVSIKAERNSPFGYTVSCEFEDTEDALAKACCFVYYA
jgi:hypothetical protein